MDRKWLVALAVGLLAAVAILVVLSRQSPPDVTQEGANREGGPAAPGGEAASGPGPGEAGDGETPAEPAKGPILVVAVLGPEGRPLPDVGVLLVSGGAVAGRGTTGRDGEVRLAAPGGEGEVVVLPGWAPPRRQAATLGEGRIEVAIPPGAAIEGRVVLVDRDGEGPPDRPLELSVWSRTPFEGFETAPQPFPNETRTWRLTTRTGPDGTFAFRGLPREWHAFLVAPDEHVLVEPAGNGKTLPVVAPMTRLLVRLRRLAVLEARIVRVNGSPAAGAEARFSWSGGSHGATAGADGRIRIVLPPPPHGEARLESTDGIVAGRWPLSPETLTADLDLGDLELPARREAALLVLSRDGKPMAGARAVAEGGARARPVGPSGADGRLTIMLPAPDPRVRVAALGHGFARAVVPPGEGPHPVTLPGGNSLTLRLEERDGKTPAGPLRVEVRGEAPLFAWEGEGPDPLTTAAAGHRPTSWARGDDEESCMFIVRRGTLRIDGLAPGRPFRIEVVDPVSGSVLAEESVTLPAEAEREITIRLEGVVRTLEGRAVDEDGKPVAGAIVLATLPGGGLRASAGADGRFRVPGLRVDRVDLRVTRHGHAPFEKAGLAVPAGGKTVEVTLPRGRTVRVEVVDTAGAPVSAAEVGATAEGLSEPFDGLDEKPGTFAVKDLPPGRVTLFAVVAGRRVELAHDTAETKARIVVPRTGSLAMRIRFALDRPVIHRLCLEPLDARGTAVTEDVHVDGKSDRTVVVPAVLPGRYSVRLEAWKEDEDEEEDVYEPVVEGPEVTVRAGVRTEAEMVC